MTSTRAARAAGISDARTAAATRIVAAPVPLGTHDVLVKRAGGAERRYTITVGVKPFTLNADFR